MSKFKDVLFTCDIILDRVIFEMQNFKKILGEMKKTVTPEEERLMDRALEGIELKTPTNLVECINTMKKLQAVFEQNMNAEQLKRAAEGKNLH